MTSEVNTFESLAMMGILNAITVIREAITEIRKSRFAAELENFGLTTDSKTDSNRAGQSVAIQY
jgi:hypothetical protein